MQRGISTLQLTLMAHSGVIEVIFFSFQSHGALCLYHILFDCVCVCVNIPNVKFVIHALPLFSRFSPFERRNISFAEKGSGMMMRREGWRIGECM